VAEQTPPRCRCISYSWCHWCCISHIANWCLLAARAMNKKAANRKILEFWSSEKLFITTASIFPVEVNVETPHILNSEGKWTVPCPDSLFSLFRLHVWPAAGPHSHIDIMPINNQTAQHNVDKDYDLDRIHCSVHPTGNGVLYGVSSAEKSSVRYQSVHNSVNRSKERSGSAVKSARWKSHE